MKFREGLAPRRGLRRSLDDAIALETAEKPRIPCIDPHEHQALIQAYVRLIRDLEKFVPNESDEGVNAAQVEVSFLFLIKIIVAQYPDFFQFDQRRIKQIAKHTEINPMLSKLLSPEMKIQLLSASVNTLLKEINRLDWPIEDRIQSAIEGVLFFPKQKNLFLGAVRKVWPEIISFIKTNDPYPSAAAAAYLILLFPEKRGEVLALLPAQHIRVLVKKVRELERTHLAQGFKIEQWEDFAAIQFYESDVEPFFALQILGSAKAEINSRGELVLELPEARKLSPPSELPVRSTL